MMRVASATGLSNLANLPQGSSAGKLRMEPDVYESRASSGAAPRAPSVSTWVLLGARALAAE